MADRSLLPFTFYIIYHVIRKKKKRNLETLLSLDTLNWSINKILMIASSISCDRSPKLGTRYLFFF